MAYTGGLDQVEFYEDLLFRSGSDKREKSICILENNPHHAAFLLRGLGEIEKFLPGNLEICRVVITLWGFEMSLSKRSIGYGEIVGQSIRRLSQKPDIIILSFLPEYDADVINDLLKCLGEWTENGAVVLFASSESDETFSAPCYSRYDPEGIRYIENYLTSPYETVM